MEIIGESLDDVLIQLYQELPKSSLRNTGTRGETLELIGVLLRIHKPRARLSRSEDRGKPFSAVGELLWYLSGSDKLDFIRPYVRQYEKDAEGGVIHGAYGPRLFSMRGVNQVDSVTALLRNRPGSRRAVIQLLNAEDIADEYKEIPCTTTLQFLLRDGALHLSVHLRSNDAYWGLPHDVFCFSMLQEMMARRLQVELGEYIQYAGSMHVYIDYVDSLTRYVEEGHQRLIEMPAMPAGDPFDVVGSLLVAEDKIRHGEELAASELGLDPYWADIVRLLQTFWAQDEAWLDHLRAEFAYPNYGSYLDGRRGAKPRTIERR